MESAVFLGREASLDLCSKSGTAASPSTDSDWQIVSICSPGSLTLSSHSSQAAAMRSAPRSESDCSERAPGTSAIKRLDLCTLDLGIPCTSRKVRTPRTRRGKPKVSTSTVVIPDGPLSRPLSPDLSDEPVVTPMTVEISLDDPRGPDRPTPRIWNPFARFLGSQRQQPESRNLNLTGVSSPTGDDIIDTSEFVRDPHLLRCSGRPDSEVFLSGYASDEGSDSQPDIDAVMARCTIGVADDAMSESKADEILSGRGEASSEHGTAQEAAIHQIAADAHRTGSDIVEAVPLSGSTRVLLHKIHVTQVARCTIEKKQASILRGAKKNKKCMQAARRQEKLSQNAKRGGMSTS